MRIFEIFNTNRANARAIRLVPTYSGMSPLLEKSWTSSLPSDGVRSVSCSLVPLSLASPPLLFGRHHPRTSLLLPRTHLPSAGYAATCQAARPLYAPIQPLLVGSRRPSDCCAGPRQTAPPICSSQAAQPVCAPPLVGSSPPLCVSIQPPLVVSGCVAAERDRPRWPLVGCAAAPRARQCRPSGRGGKLATGIGSQEEEARDKGSYV